MYQYKKLKLKNGTTIDEHRYVMEQFLGRKLQRNEVVHHKDENKRNNHISNLEVMSLTEHARMHAKINWESEQYRKNASIKQKEAAKKRLKDHVYTCSVLSQSMVELARQAWPCSGSSLRSFSKHYNISRNAMTSILRSVNLV